MEQLPSNSHNSRAQAAEPKKIERVVTGEVTTRKKPILRRATDSFFANRADRVGEYVILDVLLPAAKNTLVDAATSFLDHLFFGEAGRGRGTSLLPPGGIGSYGTTAQVAYNRLGNPMPSAPQEPRISRRGRAMHNFKEVVIPTRVEAESLLDQLVNRIMEYNAVTVADLYEFCGITPDFTDDKFGWTDIRGAGVLRVRNGFVLDLPRPEQLD